MDGISSCCALSKTPTEKDREVDLLSNDCSTNKLQVVILIEPSKRFSRRSIKQPISFGSTIFNGLRSVQSMSWIRTGLDSNIVYVSLLRFYKREDLSAILHMLRRDLEQAIWYL